MSTEHCSVCGAERVAVREPLHYRDEVRDMRATDLERQFMLAAWEYCKLGMAHVLNSHDQDKAEDELFDAYDRLRAAGGPRP